MRTRVLATIIFSALLPLMALAILGHGMANAAERPEHAPSPVIQANEHLENRVTSNGESALSKDIGIAPEQEFPISFLKSVL